jgi:hypothetical protein
MIDHVLLLESLRHGRFLLTAFICCVEVNTRAIFWSTCSGSAVCACDAGAGIHLRIGCWTEVSKQASTQAVCMWMEEEGKNISI